MSSNTSSSDQYSNPVLSHFLGFQVQPYWLCVIELLFLQILLRLYSLIDSTCRKKKKHIYISLEIAILGPKRTGVSPEKYSIIDFILSLLSLGNFGYAIYMQTQCMSAVNASQWNCYNAFGYRLFNYVLPSVVSVLVDSIVQLINMIKATKKNKETDPSKNDMNCLKWTLLGFTLVMNSAVSLVFIVYLVTNVVPMLIAYCWILLPILGGLILVYAILITSIINGIRKCKDCGCVYCLKFFGTHCVVGAQVFGCLVMSMAYNYSQYSYFGASFTSVPSYEYQSRDTIAWYNAITNSSELLVHNLLTPF